MRCKAHHFALWTALALFNTVPGFAIAMNTATPDALIVPESANPWPWLALGAILLLLAVIAWAARRRLPFGKRL